MIHKHLFLGTLTLFFAFLLLKCIFKLQMILKHFFSGDLTPEPKKFAPQNNEETQITSAPSTHIPRFYSSTFQKAGRHSTSNTSLRNTNKVSALYPSDNLYHRFISNNSKCSYSQIVGGFGHKIRRF